VLETTWLKTGSSEFQYDDTVQLICWTADEVHHN